jgi:hypothetical protein
MSQLPHIGTTVVKCASVTKWENFPSGYATKPVESQHGGQKVFRELYIKPHGGRGGLFLHVAFPCNLALNPSTQSILSLIIGTYASERYMTCCRKLEYITCWNSACRNSACRNNAMYPKANSGLECDTLLVKYSN